MASSDLCSYFWVIANWTIRNKLQWNFNQNTKLFIFLWNGGHFVQGRGGGMSKQICLHQSGQHITPRLIYMFTANIYVHLKPSLSWRQFCPWCQRSLSPKYRCTCSGSWNRGVSGFSKLFLIKPRVFYILLTIWASRLWICLTGGP